MSDTLLTPRFHVIGTQLNAWRDQSGGSAVTLKNSSGTSNVIVSSSSDTGAFGSSMLAMASTTNIRAVQYPGKSNWSDVAAFSVLMRIIPRWTGAPSANEQGFFDAVYPTNSGAVGIYAGMDTNGKPYMGIYDQYATAYMNPNTDWGTAFTGFVSGTAIDLLFVWDGTTNAAKMYTNGTLAASLTPAAGSPTVNNQLISAITFGMCHTGGSLSDYDLNEAAIWDYALSSADITNLTARSTFLATTSFDGTAYSDPGIANVRSGTVYTVAGSSLTGTCAVPTTSQVLNGVSVGSATGNVVLPSTSDVLTGINFGPSSGTSGTLIIPTASQVLNGVSFGSTTGNVVLPTDAQVELSVTFGPSSSCTGTYTGSNLWSDPGVLNVRYGTSYNANGSGLIGSCAVPTASQVLNDIAIDATYGNVTLPTASEVLTGINFGPSSGTAGTTTLPSPNYVLTGVTFGPSSSETGTLVPVQNSMVQMQLKQNPSIGQVLVMTQGDSFTFNFQAISNTGVQFNLTGASFSSTMLNTDNSYVVWGNSAHVADPNQTANTGNFTLVVSSTSNLKVGTARTIITTVTVESDIIQFQGTIDVLSSQIT